MSAFFTSRCFCSSHKGGLVSPTERPTIKATTASRINRANAMMMYFCQSEGEFSFKGMQGKHMMYTNVRHFLKNCVICGKHGGGDPGEKDKRLPFVIFSGISRLFWFLPLLCLYIQLHWTRSPQCCSPFLPVNVLLSIMRTMSTFSQVIPNTDSSHLHNHK